MNKKNELALQVLTLAVLASKGIKIARLSGNRKFDEKVVKSKMKSMKKNGMLVPAIIVDAKEAIKAGLEIVDFGTGETINESDAEYYVVLVDANHRYQAHLNLLKENEGLKEEEQYKGEFYLLYALNDKLAISKLLSEINICTNPWRGNDFPKSVKMANKENLPLLDFIDELTNDDWSLAAASKWATFKSDITKEILADAADNKISEKLRNTSGIERGRKLLEAAKKSFSVKFLKNRNIIDWLIAQYDKANDDNKTATVNQLAKFLESLGRDKAELIEKTKGQRGGDTKETIINRLLNNFYEQFTQSQSASTDE